MARSAPSVKRAACFPVTPIDFLLDGNVAGPDFHESISVTVNGADLAIIKTGPRSLPRATT